MAASQHPQADVIPFPREIEESTADLGELGEQATPLELARKYMTLAAQHAHNGPIIIDWMKAISAQQLVIVRRHGDLEDRLNKIEASQADILKALAEVLEEVKKNR